MKVLLVGDGAREHVLAEQLARSSELYVAMEKRNPGIEKISNRFYVGKISNIEAIGAWAIKRNIDIALITSERALAKGLPYVLSEAGVALASPLSSGSVIGENSAYSFNLMKAAGIARPKFFVCKTQTEVRKVVKEIPRLVVKPSIRVEWKGTKLAEKDFKKKTDIVKYGKKMIERHGSVILEEMVDGECFSLQGMTDGKSLSVMPPVHVMKRALEGGKGDLTEGMGGFSTGRLLPFMRQRDLGYARSCLWKLVAMLRKKGVDYRGPIRGEFIITKKGTLMLASYATLGDVETLNSFLLLRTQLGEVLTSVVEGSLKPMSFLENSTVVKFLVPEKYPAKSRAKSKVVIDERTLWNNGAKAYFDYVRAKDGKIFTTSDRALAICARDLTLEKAEGNAEAAASSIKGKLRHRSDIATRGYVDKIVKHVALLRSR
jgi:phosphoribosylamine--glycine ligase